MKRQVLELIHLQMLGLLAILLLARPLQAQEMTLVDDGQALANIIVAPNASAQLGEAANELRTHLGKITGVSFAVESVDNAAPSNRSEIVLGARAAMNRCRLDIRKEALGDQGYIILGNNGWRAYSKGGKLVKQYGGGSDATPHVQNFIECIKSRKRPYCDLETVGHPASVLCHAGNIATRLGRTITFDAKTETFENDKEANAMRGRPEWRKPWVLPAV